MPLEQRVLLLHISTYVVNIIEPSSKASLTNSRNQLLFRNFERERERESKSTLFFYDNISNFVLIDANKPTVLVKSFWSLNLVRYFSLSQFWWFQGYLWSNFRKFNGKDFILGRKVKKIFSSNLSVLVQRWHWRICYKLRMILL